MALFVVVNDEQEKKTERNIFVSILSFSHFVAHSFYLRLLFRKAF